MGIRVIDFGQYIAGPLAAVMLADQGADVVHVDPPTGPRWKSDADAFLQRGKRRIALDLKTPAGQETATARRQRRRRDRELQTRRDGPSGAWRGRLAADARDDCPQYVTLGYTPVPALSVRHRRRSRGEREGLKGVLMVAVVRPLLPKTDALAPAADAQSYYSVSQAAGLLGVSRMSIWRWVRAGRLPVARFGHRTARIRREDLDRLVLESRLRIVPDRMTEDAIDPDRAPRSTWSEMGPSEHLVQFYEADAVLVETVVEYVGAGLRAGAEVIAVITEAHRAEVEEGLRSDGLDLDTACAGGQYLAVDAAETLALIMADGRPSPARFEEVIGTVV